jgi:hypothetical protein
MPSVLTDPTSVLKYRRPRTRNRYRKVAMGRIACQKMRAALLGTPRVGEVVNGQHTGNPAYSNPSYSVALARCRRKGSVVGDLSRALSWFCWAGSTLISTRGSPVCCCRRWGCAYE